MAGEKFFIKILQSEAGKCDSHYSSIRRHRSRAIRRYLLLHKLLPGITSGPPKNVINNYFSLSRNLLTTDFTSETIPRRSNS